MKVSGHINAIELDNLLPSVFAEGRVSDTTVLSDVWLGSAFFLRPHSYIVEASSGAGKSSLCAYVYGLRRDYIGTIRFDGRDIRTLSMEEWCGLRTRSLAFLPQDMSLFPELTVMENIEIKNRLTRRYSSPEIETMLERLSIADKMTVPASRLSIGQMQRVAIVRALCQPFDFLLLDEPVSHLDSANNAAVASLVMETVRENGAALIATSVGNKLAINPDVTYML